jgi:hypothetical protein
VGVQTFSESGCSAPIQQRCTWWRGVLPTKSSGLRYGRVAADDNTLKLYTEGR